MDCTGCNHSIDGKPGYNCPVCCSSFIAENKRLRDLLLQENTAAIINGNKAERLRTRVELLEWTLRRSLHHLGYKADGTREEIKAWSGSMEQHKRIADVILGALNGGDTDER